MPFTIVHQQWRQTFDGMTDKARAKALIISPFLGRAAIRRILGDHPGEVKAITRFNLDELSRRVSDIEALDYLLSVGAEVRGIKHLHSKVYIFGSNSAVVTSANLTGAGLSRNMEYGVKSDDAGFVASAIAYFESLWVRGRPLTPEMLLQWKRLIDNFSTEQTDSGHRLLGDFGADLGLDSPSDEGFGRESRAPAWRWFVKLVGTNADRLSLDTTVAHTLEESDTYSRLWYPKNKRPRSVRDGDLVFIGRMVKPADIMIYGRARTFKHMPDQDDASAQDIRKRNWKSKWPHFVRLDGPEFVNCTLADCISLYKVMDELGWDTFATTRDRALGGQKAVNPKTAYSQQPAVRLTPRAAELLNKRLDDRFAIFGRIPSSALPRG